MATPSMDLNEVCLAISSFRNDGAVVAMLERLFAAGAHFGSVLIVDSQGSGAMPTLLKQRGLEGRVGYICYQYNLGSAGNLAERLRHAANLDASFVYTINHDGVVDPVVVARLVEELRSDPDLGAVYPLRRMTSREASFDVTGVLPIPFKALTVKRRPKRRAIRVWWSSSNGALYNLEPVRRGLAPWGDLWMGWEDLGYGWLLASNGYRQVIVTDAVVDDAYEYQLKAGVWVTDKPAWYSYYSSRNLIVAAQRTARSPMVKAAVAGRLALEYGMTLMARSDKLRRCAYLSAGIRDAFGGRLGHWKVP